MVHFDKTGAGNLVETQVDVLGVSLASAQKIVRLEYLINLLTVGCNQSLASLSHVKNEKLSLIVVACYNFDLSKLPFCVFESVYKQVNQDLFEAFFITYDR